jgi:hypothetical protein
MSSDRAALAPAVGETVRMTSRREFLQIGIAASAWPLATQAARAAGFDGLGAAAFGGAPPLPLYKVVYDTRFAASVAFGNRAASLGAAVHAIQGDMTSVWFDDIYHRWKGSPVAIAGLTAQGPLFCFERLAWDQGLRVVFRAEHGAAEHVLSGPRSLLAEARGALASPDWAAQMATVVTRCPSGRAEIGSAAFECASGSGIAAEEPLYSWVIAPAARA